MTVKAVVDWARAVPGSSGVAIYTGDTVLYREAIDGEYVKAMLDLLKSSPDARRASVAAGGFTFVAFNAGDYTVVLKVSGRFPALSVPGIEEPTFIDPSCAPALPSKNEAKREAEAALRQFGLLS
ncbi:MAG TPA: hypothetical protein VGJ92_04820 [Methanocella sp.]